MAGREKKVAPKETINIIKTPERFPSMFKSREDMILDILLQITDACYEESGNDTRWKPIHDQIVALMK
jgi:hypothetical protein